MKKWISRKSSYGHYCEVIALAPSGFEDLGFCIIPEAVAVETLDELTRSLEVISADTTDGLSPGTRNPTALSPAIVRFAHSPEVAALLASLGLPGGFLVRSILFDKQPGANWKVPWHQDLTIAVCERLEVPGFGPWSEKAGIPHVQPPASVLERMIALRLHIDDCGAENGALRVIPRSHRDGVLSPDEVQSWRRDYPEHLCKVPAGGILAMRPLLLHASSQAVNPSHRRVIHLEYAREELPCGLKWPDTKDAQ